MNAISLQPQLRASANGLAVRAARPARAVSRSSLHVVAEESMTDAYARIRESRARAAAERKALESGKPLPKAKKGNGLSLVG
eukprot:7790546-Pyramimonas_sp.AAC.1